MGADGPHKAPVFAMRLVGSYGNQSRAFYVRDHVTSPPTLGKSMLTSNHQIAKRELLQCPLITHLNSDKVFCLIFQTRLR